MKLKLGQYVRHSKYGWGTILDSAGNYTTVFFNTLGVRKFALSEAFFDVVEGKAVKKKPRL